MAYKPKNTPAPADDQPVRTVTVNVAPGRTLVGGDGEDYGPGAEIEIEEKEARRLHRGGHVVLPGYAAPTLPDGPKVLNEGPTVFLDGEKPAGDEAGDGEKA